MRRITQLSTVVAVLCAVHAVKAQQTPDADAARRGKLAEALDTEEYGRAFFAGAQAELVVPDIGVSAALLGYDAVWVQTELSLGLGVGGAPAEGMDQADNYIAALRFAFPIHRGIRSDFALLIGGGVTLIDPPEASTFALGSAGVGAKFRAFFTPNVAVGAALGVVAFIHGEDSLVVLGARPLGAASVVYFFR